MVAFRVSPERAAEDRHVPADTIGQLTLMRQLFEDSTLLLAQTILEVPELEAKEILAAHLFREATARDVVTKRLQELPDGRGAVEVCQSETAESETCRDIVLRIGGLSDARIRYVAIYGILRPAIVALLQIS